VDPHEFVREGLKLILEYRPRLLLVGEGKSPAEILPLCDRTHPDILLFDFTSRDDFSAVEQVRKLYSQVKVLVLTVNMEAECVIQAVKAGASGYVFKSLGGDELEEAIWTVYRGQQVFDDEAAKIINGPV
jgi:DNA-binding NarL/FixJ family response regulator